VARGEYADAYRAIRAANPLPSVCARVCHHPCERSCRSGSTGGDPIAWADAIKEVKAFLAARLKAK
jgi:NADH-quinone oxidoreductase subunit F